MNESGFVGVGVGGCKDILVNKKKNEMLNYMRNGL